MAKRSGTSKGGGSKTKNKSEYYGNSATSGHVHEDEYGTKSSHSQRVKWVREVMPDATDEEVGAIVDNIRSWSGSGYGFIREAQANAIDGKTYDEYQFAKGETLENYIKAAPKFKGQIYRGITVDDDTYTDMMNKLSNGGTIDMRGAASWSTSLSIARSFSSYGGYEDHAVVFVLNGNTKAGTTIQHLSNYGKTEEEVLVSSKTRYSATKIETDSTGRTVIHVNEHLVS